MATKTRITVEEFLALPESKPYLELMDGEVVEKAMPTLEHGRLAGELYHLLRNYQRNNPTFRVVPEVRHLDEAVGWVFLPDVAVTMNTRLVDTAEGKTNPVRVIPDFAIEVLSPEDRPGMLTRRITYYSRAGTTLLWLVDPESETITVWDRGGGYFEADPARPLSAAPVLPGFELDIPALFAVLHDE